MLTGGTNLTRSSEEPDHSDLTGGVIHAMCVLLNFPLCGVNTRRGTLTNKPKGLQHCGSPRSYYNQTRLSEGSIRDFPASQLGVDTDNKRTWT